MEEAAQAVAAVVTEDSDFLLYLHSQRKNSLNMKTILLFQNFGLWEILIIALVILLLFGGKKIPELMKGLGKGVKNFKEGLSEAEKDLQDIKKDLDKPSGDEEK